MEKSQTTEEDKLTLSFADEAIVYEEQAVHIILCRTKCPAPPLTPRRGGGGGGGGGREGGAGDEQVHVNE